MDANGGRVSARPERVHPSRLAAWVIGAVLPLWGAELVLSRLTGIPQPASDILLAFVFWGVVGACTWVATILAGRFLGKVAGSWAQCLFLHSPLALFTAAMLGVRMLKLQVAHNAPMVAGAAVATYAVGAIVFWRWHRPQPSGLLTAGVVTCAAVACWVLGGSFPGMAIVAGTVVLVVAVAALAERGWMAIGAGAIVVFVSTFPGFSPTVSWPDRDAGSGGPDIVLLTVDTLRRDAALSMESFQRLAAEGIMFEEAQADAPWTLPSVVTILTGQPSPVHGVYKSAESKQFGTLHPGTETLFSRLWANGYDTAAIVENPYLTKSFGFLEHADYLYSRVDRHRFGLPECPGPIGCPLAVGLLRQAGLWGQPPIGTAADLLERAEAVLEARRDRPLLLWVHLLDVHTPYFHADGMTDLPYRTRVSLQMEVMNDMVLSPYSKEMPEGRAILRRAYDNEVEILDEEISRFLDVLESRSNRERILVFAVDHGEEFFDHGSFEHGHTFYQELIGTPLVITGVTERRTAAEGEVAGHIDIVPTVLAAVGLSTDGLPGRDLARPGVSGAYVSQNPHRFGDDRPLFAVREGRWKAIFYPDRTVLFDLKTDPLEQTDRFADHPEIAQRLRAERSREGIAREELEMDPHVRKELEALGYTLD